MARSKQNKTSSKKVDGKYRHETREERRARLQQQQEAREQCLKLLPYAGGAIFLVMTIFAIYVRSVPPVTIPKVTVPQPQFEGGIPEFTAVNTEPNVKVVTEDNPDAPPETVTNFEPNEAAAEETMEL